VKTTGEYYVIGAVSHVFIVFMYIDTCDTVGDVAELPKLEFVGFKGFEGDDYLWIWTYFMNVKGERGLMLQYSTVSSVLTFSLYLE
jgi:hypothetical protein